MKRRENRLPIHRLDGHGSPPGTLRAPPNAVASKLTVLAYSPDAFVEEPAASLERALELREEFPVVWINLEGLADVELLQQLGDRFSLHKLALEDTLNIPQRSKLDDYTNHQYFVARMPMSRDTLETEQVSVFMGEGFILTVQEKPGDCFDGIRDRIREGRPRIRENGADYLGYTIIDALVEAYFPLLESAVSRLDELELMILKQAEKKHIAELHDLKRGLITLRRYLSPLHELISLLARGDNVYFSEQTRVYLRDSHDHAKKAFDLVESYRDITKGLMDLYLSLMSQKMNEVMKVLTIIATVFIPLSFIAGLYGMNFDPAVSRWNMPELGWAFGYPMALGVMFLAAGTMLAFFWKKGWFR